MTCEALEGRTLLAAGVSPTVKLIDHFPAPNPRKTVMVVPRSVEVLERDSTHVAVRMEVEAGFSYRLHLRRNNREGKDRFAGSLAVTRGKGIGEQLQAHTHAPGRANTLIYHADDRGTVRIRLGRHAGWRQTFSIKRITTTVEEPTGATVAPGRFKGAISGFGNTDRYAFDTAKNTQYTFAPTPGTLRDTVLRILSADGQLMAFSDQERIFLNGRIQKVDRNPALTWIAPEAGRYRLEVGGHSAGSYEVDVIAAPDDHITRTTLSLPAMATGAIDFEVDQDEFVFNATEGSTYRVTSDDDVLIYLVSPSGKPTHRPLRKREAPWGQPSHTFTATETGRYRLTVGLGGKGYGEPTDYNIAIAESRPKGAPRSR